MRMLSKKIRIKIKQTIAFLLVICMLPLSSFPARAVQIDEIPIEQGKTISGESVPQNEVVVESAKKEAEVYYDPSFREQSIGDKSVTDTWVLEEDTVVDELFFSGEKIDLNGYTLTVCEDFILEKGYFSSNYGNLIVWGDFRMQARVWDEEQQSYVYGESEASISVYGSDSDPSYILICGDMFLNSTNVGQYRVGGTWELKGSLYQRENEEAKTSDKYISARDGLCFDGLSTLILSGTDKQILQWSGTNTTNQIGTLVIENESAEGVIFEREPLVYKAIQMTKKNKTSGILRIFDCVDFTGGYFCGDLKVCDYSGVWIKTKLELDGNLYLQGSLTAEGDITIRGDVIVLDRERGYSNSCIYANNSNFVIDGNINAGATKEVWTFYVRNYSDSKKEFYVGGDFIGENVNFMADGVTVKFCGNVSVSNATGSDNKVTFYTNSAHVIFCGQQGQEIDLGGATERFWFGTLESQNESEEGVRFNALTNVTTLILNGNKVYFEDNLAIEGKTLEEDLVFETDTIFLSGIWDLNGHNLICKGDLRVYEGSINVNGGKLSVSGNCLVDYHGMIDMTNEKDVVEVEKNMTFMSRYSTEGHLTNGLLIVHGNFSTLAERGYDKGFYATDEHVTRIIRKKYSDEIMQKIVLENDQKKPYFATLEIGREGGKYYEYDGELKEVAQTLSTYYFDEEKPSDVEGIKANNIGITDVSLSYDKSNDLFGIDFYSIWRNGSEIARTTELVYKDTGLQPDSEYEYAVYAVNEIGAWSGNSDAISVHTKIDTIEPDRVEEVRTVKRSGSSITIRWNESKDNCGVVGYKVYRDNELICEEMNDLNYIDNGLSGNTLYSYYVTAVDAAGNESEKSKVHQEATVMPEPVKTIPEDYAAIGGNTQILKIIFVHHDNTISNRVKVEYYDYEEEKWIVIANDIESNTYISKDLPLGKSYNIATLDWDLSEFTEQEDIRIKYTVYDSEMNEQSLERTYRVDREVPDAIMDLVAEEKNGVPIFSWSPLKKNVCSGYRLYRREKGNRNYKKIKDIEGYASSSCFDTTGKEGVTYEYIIRAMDEFEQESIDSNCVELTISEDEEAPALIRMTPMSSEILSTDEKILLYGKDNKKICSGKLVIANERGMVTEITSATFDSENTIILWWQTSQYADGKYNVKAYLYDENGNESNYIERNYVLDNTGPSKVELTKCEVNGMKAYLSWENLGSDARSYVIQKLDDDKWCTAGTIKGKLYYEINDLLPETTYSYRVYARDEYGNAGEVSEVWTFTTEKDTQGPVITAIGPEDGKTVNNLYLAMAAMDNVELAKGVFSYSLDGTNYKVIKTSEVKNVTNTKFTTSFVTTDIPEGDLFVKFEAYDSYGNKNSLLNDEDIVCVYHIDHTPPVSISDVECTCDEGAAVLAWNDVKADKYYVYRSISKEGNYRIIGEVKQTTYTDATVEEYEIYYYKICAVDEAGNMSECTAPLSVQIKKDEIAPEMVSLSPNKNQIYGPGTYMQAIALDNAMLSKIIFEYKVKGSDEWIFLEERPVTGTSGYAGSLWTDTDLEENTEYLLRAKAVDKSGNVSEYIEECCWFDFTPPEAPNVSLAKKGNGLEISYSRNTESDFDYYKVYRKAYESDDDFRCIFSTETCAYTDGNVEPGKLYLYKVVAVDQYGNESTSNQVSGYAESEDVTKPAAICAEEMTAVAGREVYFDGLLSYDNERISKFEWDFGDGTTSKQSCPKHCYESAGIYNVKLTVTDANGNEDTTCGMVVVSEETVGVGTVTFRLTNLDGKAIDSVYTTIREKDITLTSGSDGKIEFVAEAGIYHVSFESNQYRLNEIKVEVEAGTNKTIDVTMYSRAAVDASWNIHEMSYDEILAADIDLSEPENFFTCKYTIELFYENVKNPSVWISYDTPSRTSSSLPPAHFGASNKDEKVKETPCYRPGGITREPARMVSYDNFRALILPVECQTISWLKNMYSARLEVYNISEGDVELYDVSATIDLQEGLALAGKTSGEQKMTQYIGTLGKEESQTVEWQIRGDAPGNYTITGVLSGAFGDTGDSFSTSIEGDLKVNEQHTEGLHLYVRPEGRGYLKEKYYVQYELVNESSQTFYQVTTNFGETQTTNNELIVEVIQGGKVVRRECTDGNVSYYLPRANDAGSIPTLSGGSVTVGELKPEQSITGTYVSKFKGGGSRYYKQFVDAFVDQISGFNADITITVLPTQSHIDKWQVFLPTLKIPAGYPNKTNKDEGTENSTMGGQTTDSTEDTEDPVNMMTGAFYTSQNVMSVSGVRDLVFELNYESTKTDEKGMLGYGWYHTYESFVKDENGLVQLYLNPQDKITFVRENVKENIVQGTYEDGVVTLLPLAEEEEKFVVLHDYYVGYTMTKTESGYEVSLPDGTVNLYDMDGKLIRTTNLYGQSIVFSHAENSYTIKDETSGKTIIAHKDEGGKITTLTDPAGNTVQFIYDAQENLVAIKNKRGYSLTYAYIDHKLTQAWDADERLYLVNTYDEEGRVLTQDDGQEDTPIATFTYEEDEETGNLSIHISGRNGGKQDVISDVRGNGVKYTNSLGGIKTYTYDNDGNMTSSTFANGKTEYYSYDDEGNLTQIKDSVAGLCNYTYNEMRQVTEYNDSAGNIKNFYYNEKNLLIKEVANGVTTTYTYNENGQKLTEEIEGRGVLRYTYDDNGNQTSITYPDGSKDSFTYDAIGNVIGYTNRKGVVTKYEIDPNGHVLSESILLSDGTEVVTAYTYDPYGNVISKIDRNGNKTSYSYDEDGNCIKETRADGSAISYSYDTDGNITSVIYPDGTTTQNAVYDTAGNLKRLVDVLSQITTGEYNSASQLIKTTQADGGIVTYDYYGNGLLKSQTDAEGNTTTYIYDEAGRVTSITNPKGNVVTITYDSYGNMNALTDGEGNTVTMSYNAFGEMIATNDANGNKTAFAYDSMGNCISMTDAIGNVTEYTYDAIGQIIAVTQKGKNSEDISISYSYDNLGNITAVTDGEENTYRMTYDKVGNMTGIYDAYDRLVESYSYDSVYNQVSVTDGNGAKISYSYDSMGNKVKTLNESNGSATIYSYIGGNLISAATDALGGKTSATYDSMGNLASFTNPNGGVTTYTYDKNQNLTSESVGDYYNVKYTYDENGNVKTMTNSRGQVTTYEYDKADRVIKQTDEAGIIVYTYDANGNKLKVTETVSGKTVSANTITRTYDALNRVTSYTDAEGNIIKYKYDEFGNIISLIYPGNQNVDYTYDKNGNVLTATDWSGRETSYEYDKNGRLIKTVRPDGSVETRTYDKAGNLIALKDITKDGTVINDYTYSYDLSGNITQIYDKCVDTETQKAAKESAAHMEYDSVNRLMKYNGKEVKYDADGNMIYGPLNGEMATFTYDCRNRLIEAKTDSGEATKYAYDAENVRIKVIKNAGTQKESIATYVTDSVSDDLSRVLQAETVDKNGTTETTLYTYGKGLIAQEKGAEYLLYHFDHLGSTTAVTDVGGEIKYTYAYNIFGKLLSGNYGEVEFLYNGQYGVTSDANGLYYMRARYYNIDIMRFINQDILTGSIDSSQSLNRYAYVEGNPVNFLDPFGLDEYKVDTSTAHDVLTVLGAIAFVVGATAAAPAVVASALIAGTFFAGVNAGLYMYDAMEADTKEERDTALANSALSLATIGTGIVSNTGKIVISINAKNASMDQAYYALKKVLDTLTNYLSLEGVE